MSGGNKPATTTTNQSRSPWAPAQGNLQTALTNAGNIAGDLSNFTPQYSATTQAGIGGLENAAQNFATNGTAATNAISPVVQGSGAGFQTGLGQLQNTAQGGYLNSNPYFDQALNAGLEATRNNVNSTFAGAGRYGSAAHTGALTQQLGNLESSARLNNYNTERGNQDAASRTLFGGGFTGAGFGSQLDQSSLLPAQLQLQAGGLRDQQALAQQQAPMNATNWLSSITNPIASLGGTTNQTSQTVQPSNPWTQALGIGQMGLGLLTGNPVSGTQGLLSMFGGGGGGSGGASLSAGSNPLFSGSTGSWGNIVGGI